MTLVDAKKHKIIATTHFPPASFKKFDDSISLCHELELLLIEKIFFSDKERWCSINFIFWDTNGNSIKP